MSGKGEREGEPPGKKGGKEGVCFTTKLEKGLRGVAPAV